ncbi:MAG: succinate dehydrogenase, cytochrome b556 subunit [Gammaproteobacteria bacterium]|nr:succinate dehydrogenase, cytochrome b556 subunit [Gammaproteobacteria bacterium]
MSTPSSAPNRPLSPFMLGQYYRFQLTSVLSFLHRLTGVGLSLGAALLALWLIALAGGPWMYAAVARHLTAWYGQVLLFGFTWALMYHLGNGIRHLVWDFGYAFSMKAVYAGGYIVAAASLLLTAAVWALAYAI